MELPTIHSNGTNAKTLIEEYDEVALALGKLERAWEAVEFNARDYYPQGMDVWASAVRERQSHSGNLRELRDYVNAMRDHLHACKTPA